MANPKVHLPLQPDLVQDAQNLAQTLNISWATLITLALRDFIQRYGRRKNLTQQITAAYSIESSNEEVCLTKAMRFNHQQIVKGEW